MKKRPSPFPTTEQCALRFLPKACRCLGSCRNVCWHKNHFPCYYKNCTARNWRAARCHGGTVHTLTFTLAHQETRMTKMKWDYRELAVEKSRSPMMGLGKFWCQAQPLGISSLPPPPNILKTTKNSSADPYPESVPPPLISYRYLCNADSCRKKYPLKHNIYSKHC